MIIKMGVKTEMKVENIKRKKRNEKKNELESDHSDRQV